MISQFFITFEQYDMIQNPTEYQKLSELENWNDKYVKNMSFVHK